MQQRNSAGNTQIEITKRLECMTDHDLLCAVILRYRENVLSGLSNRGGDKDKYPFQQGNVTMLMIDAPIRDLLECLRRI